MSIIEFETGEKVEFEGTPTAQDVDYVAKQLNISQPKKEKSFLRKTGEFLGDITGISGTVKGVNEASKVAKGLYTGKEHNPAITPESFAGSAATLGLTAASLGGAGTAGTLGARVAKTAALGAGLGGASAMQDDANLPGIVKQAGVGAAVGAAVPLAETALSKAVEVITKHLPSRIVKSVLPADKDITQHVLENTKLGPTAKMLDTTKNNIDDLSQNIDDILEVSKKSIIKKDLLKSVAQSYGQTGGGGTINGTDVEKIVTKVAPQFKGLLSKDVLTIKEANKLRKGLDKVLGNKFYLSTTQPPFTKDVLGNFTSFLRDTVKASEPKTVPFFEELTKEITLKNALVKASKKLGHVGLYDLIGGVGGFATQGPIGAVTGVAIERAARSPATGIGLAKGLTKLGEVAVPSAVKNVVRTGLLKGIPKI